MNYNSSLCIESSVWIAVLDLKSIFRLVYVCNAINQRLCCICSKKGDTMPSADFYWRLKIVAWCCAALWYFKVNIFPHFSLMCFISLSSMFRICIFWQDWNMTPAWRWSSVASSTWKPSKWSLPFLGKKDRYQTETETHPFARLAPNRDDKWQRQSVENVENICLIFALIIGI